MGSSYDLHLFPPLSSEKSGMMINFVKNPEIQISERREQFWVVSSVPKLELIFIVKISGLFLLLSRGQNLSYVRTFINFILFAQTLVGNF